MFPLATTPRTTKRSLRQMVRSAVGTAVEFATLGEVGDDREPLVVPVHPHRRTVARRARERRPGGVQPRPEVCVASRR